MLLGRVHYRCAWSHKRCPEILLGPGESRTARDLPRAMSSCFAQSASSTCRYEALDFATVRAIPAAQVYYETEECSGEVYGTWRARIIAIECLPPMALPGSMYRVRPPLACTISIPVCCTPAINKLLRTRRMTTMPLTARYATYATAFQRFRRTLSPPPRAHVPHPWPSCHTCTPPTGTEQNLACSVDTHHPHNHSGRVALILAGPHAPASNAYVLGLHPFHASPPPDTGTCLQVRYNYTNETSAGMTQLTDESDCALVRRNGDSLLWWDGIDSTFPGSDSDNCPRCVPVCLPPGTDCLCAALVLCGTSLCFVWDLGVMEWLYCLS